MCHSAVIRGWAAIFAAIPLTAATGQSAAYTVRPVDFPAEAAYLTPAGAIMVVGYNDMAEMIGALTARFTALHPGFKFDLQMPGTKAAAAALASGRSAFAPMGAALTPAQRAECRAATGGDPLEIRIAGGSLQAGAKSGPVAVIVHRDNPLQSLDAAALRVEFGDTGGPVNLRACGLPSEAPLGLFFRERVLAGGAFGRGYTAYPQSADVVRAVAADSRAIGFARANVLTPAVRALAIATEPGAAPVALTAENLTAGRYPLDWPLYLALRQPVEPWIAEFVRFVLSAEGQDQIARGTLGYRRLSAAEAARELGKLP